MGMGMMIPMSPADAEARLRRADFFIQEIDANHNGVIEAEEVEGRRRFFIDRILQQAGLEPNYPVAVTKVREGIKRYYQPYIDGTAPAMTPGATMPGAPGGYFQPGGMPQFPMGGPGGPFPGQPGQGQMSPADWEKRRQFEQMYAEARHLDEEGNRNGIIEAEETTGGRSHSHKEIFERVMAKAGLPATTPVKLELVRERLAAAYGLTPSGTPLPAGQGTAAGSGAVRGFGEPQPALPPVPGFGPPAATTTVSTSTQGITTTSVGGGGGSSGGSGSSGPSGSPEDERIRGYAKSLLSQYDRNKNGTLEPEEYREMRGDVRSADRNGDGKVDLDELIAWLKRFSQGGSGGSSGGSSGRGSASGSSTASKPGKLRLSTALERLPSGLPDWFFEKDANADGQVSMAEFASTWSESKLAEFLRYDLNGDGIITPAECLAAEKQKSVAAKESPPPEKPPERK